MFTNMCTVTTNQNQQKNFSKEQLRYLHLTLEQAQRIPYIQTIEVTPEMLEEQREKIRLAEKSVRRPNFRLWKKWGHIRYNFRKKRFTYYDLKDHGFRDDKWFRWAVDWGIDNFPDFYEKEALKCLELGLKPYQGLIFRVIGFY